MKKKAYIILLSLWAQTVTFAVTIGGTPAENALRRSASEYCGVLVVCFLSVPKVLVMTIALTYSKMAFGYTFVALFTGNIVTHYLIRSPLVNLLPHEYAFVADIAVALVDVIYVRVLSYLGPCQSFDFERLKWKYAFLAAFLGNIVSFVIFRAL